MSRTGFADAAAGPFAHPAAVYGQAAIIVSRNPAAYDQAMPAAAASGGEDLGAQITKLATLRDQGILSDAEFSEAKAKVIGGR